MNPMHDFDATTPIRIDRTKIKQSVGRCDLPRGGQTLFDRWHYSDIGPTLSFVSGYVATGTTVIFPDVTVVHLRKREAS